MWTFEGFYTRAAKEYIKTRDRRLFTIVGVILSIVIAAVSIPMAIALGEGDATLTIVLLSVYFGVILVVDTVLLLCGKRAPKCYIRVTNYGLEGYDSNGNFSFSFYNLAPIEYGEEFIVLRKRVVLQKELLRSGDWEELKTLLEKVEDELLSDDPMYQVDAPEAEFYAATVVSKRIFKKFVGWVQARTSEFHYFVTFVLESGEEVEYEVSVEMFETLLEGQSGTLVVVGDMFFDFGEGESVE